MNYIFSYLYGSLCPLKVGRGCYLIKYVNFHNIGKSLFSVMEETVLGGFLFSKWLSFLLPPCLKPSSSNLGEAWGASRAGVLSGKVRCVGTWELMKPFQNFCVGGNCVCFPTSDLLLIFLSPDIFWLRGAEWISGGKVWVQAALMWAQLPSPLWGGALWGFACNLEDCSIITQQFLWELRRPP